MLGAMIGLVLGIIAGYVFVPVIYIAIKSYMLRREQAILEAMLEALMQRIHEHESKS